MVADVGGRDFQVVDGADDVEFELASAGGGLEDAGVDLDAFGARAVEGAERGEDAGLFAGAGGAVEEEVGEVGGGGLYEVDGMSVRVGGGIWGGDRGGESGRRHSDVAKGRTDQ